MLYQSLQLQVDRMDSNQISSFTLETKAKKLFST